MTVACVLRSGGDYSPEWVRALHRGVTEHTLVPHRFVCLTDMVIEGVETIPLLHRWPGWWSKIEMFRPGLFDGPVLYLDLDTLVMGDLGVLMSYDGEFAALTDFLHPRRIQTAVMTWTPNERTEGVYHRFLRDPEGVMSERRFWSDQPFVESCIPDAVRLQDHVPGLYSLKRHARSDPPKDAVLVCGHGKPRLSDPAAGWAHRAWLALAWGAA